MNSIAIAFIASVQAIAMGLQPSPIDVTLAEPEPLAQGGATIPGEAWISCYVSNPRFSITESPQWLRNNSAEVVQVRDDCTRNGTRSYKFAIQGEVVPSAPAFQSQPLRVKVTAPGPTQEFSKEAEIGVQPAYFSRLDVISGNWSTSQPRTIDFDVLIESNGKTVISFESPDIPQWVQSPGDILVEQGVARVTAKIAVERECPTEGFNVRVIPRHAPTGIPGTEELVYVAPPCGNGNGVAFPNLPWLLLISLIAAGLCRKRAQARRE